MTRPTDNYFFAESAAPGDVTDPSGVRTGGYPFEDPLPASEFNYLMRSPGRWIDYLRYQADGYTTVQEAITNASEGELVRVLRDVASDYRGRLQGTLGGNAIITQDTDGRFLYIGTRNAGTYSFQQININDWTVNQTYTLTGAPTDVDPIRAISADGKHVAICWGGHLEVFDSTTGTRVIDIDQGGLVSAIDVQCHGASVVALWRDNGASTSFIQLHSLSTFASLALLTIALPSGGEGAITCNGRQVLVAHTTSTANETRLAAYDIVPNAGSFDLLSEITWLNDLVQHRAIETNGEYIAVGVEGNTHQVRVYRLTQLASRDVAIVDATQVGSTECHSIVFIPGLMLAASTSASNVDVTAYELGSFDIAWVDSSVSEVPIALGRTELSTDGVNLFVPSGTLAQRIGQLSTGRHSTSWLRCDPESPYRRPFYNLAIPSEGS